MEANGTDRELEQDERWIDLSASHQRVWGEKKDDTRKAISILNGQLEHYRQYRFCGTTEHFIPGCGSFNPKVIFVATHPNPFDYSESTNFTENTWIDLLKRKANSIMAPTDYYIMYIFPYYLGKDRKPTSSEERIFLPYAVRRILLLKPRFLVSLGALPSKYVFSGFNTDKKDMIPSYYKLFDELERTKKPKKISVHNRTLVLFALPHPFTVVLSESNGEQSNSMWDQCFAHIKRKLDAYNDLTGGTLFDQMLKSSKKRAKKIDKKKANTFKFRKIEKPEGQPDLSGFFAVKK